MASSINGLLFSSTYSLAFLVALYTAQTSLPSTRIAEIPSPKPRAAMPSPPYCSDVGVEMAYPLLRLKKKKKTFTYQENPIRLHLIFIYNYLITKGSNGVLLLLLSNMNYYFYENSFRTCVNPVQCFRSKKIPLRLIHSSRYSITLFWVWTLYVWLD